VRNVLFAQRLALEGNDHEKDSYTAAFAFSTLAAHAKYEQVDLTADCTREEHVSEGKRASRYEGGFVGFS
jgi:hypothetical protein